MNGPSALLTLVTTAPVLAEVHRPRPRTALSSNDCPGDAAQIDVSDRTEERLKRYEAGFRVHLLQVINGSHEPHPQSIPQARCWGGDPAAIVPLSDIVPHEGATLREDLMDVPVGRLHRIERPIDERSTDFLVEQATRGIDDDDARPLPQHGLLQPRRPKCEVKAVPVGMTGDASPPLGEALGVAVVAPGPTFVQPVTRFQVASVQSISDFWATARLVICVQRNTRRVWHKARTTGGLPGGAPEKTRRSSSCCVPFCSQAGNQTHQPRLRQHVVAAQSFGPFTGSPPVNKARERYPSENAAGPPSDVAGEQPLPHNHQKQRKIRPRPDGRTLSREQVAEKVGRDCANLSAA